ncbi:MAG: four helix bundle protein [Vicinamibacterales bacterium]
MQFSIRIVRFSEQFRGASPVVRHLAQQLLRAGTSIGANVEEARDAYSRREFAFKNAIGLREARETRCWLRLLEAAAPDQRGEGSHLMAEVNELIAILTTIVRRCRPPKVKDS